MNQLNLQERLKSSKIKKQHHKSKEPYTKLKLEAQEQFEHIAPIGFLQTTTK